MRRANAPLKYWLAIVNKILKYAGGQLEMVDNRTLFTKSNIILSLSLKFVKNLCFLEHFSEFARTTNSSSLYVTIREISIGRREEGGGG